MSEEVEFKFGRIYTDDGPVAVVKFEEVQEFDGDEDLTISWKEDGTFRLYRKIKNPLESDD
jgi:hypothetical protein